MVSGSENETLNRTARATWLAHKPRLFIGNEWTGSSRGKRREGIEAYLGTKTVIVKL